jgi:hypothetical protein
MSLATILQIAFVASLLFMHLRPGGGHGGCCGGSRGGNHAPKQDGHGTG